MDNSDFEEVSQKIVKNTFLMFVRCLIVVCVNIAFIFMLERLTTNPYTHFAMGQGCVLITSFVLSATIKKEEGTK